MMRRILLAVAVSVGCLSWSISASAQDAKKIEQGAALFVSQKCNQCHSVAGKGNVKGPMDGIGAKRTADEIQQWIVDPEGMRARTKATRTPEMKLIKLSKTQVDALVAYLMTMKSAAPDAPK